MKITILASLRQLVRQRLVLCLLVGLAACAAGTASYGQTTLIDTTTNANNYGIATTPHTYVGDGFTNNTLPANTTSFQVTSGSVALVSGTATTYTDVQARIQLWNTVTPTSTTAVFSNPLGLITVDYGGLTLAANSVYILPYTLNGNIFPTLLGGSGTTWGITINFQGSTAVGTAVADTTNLSPAVAYNTNTTGYAAGTITTGTSPDFGYYRNVEGQTNFNFVTGDSRNLGTTYEGVGFTLAGNPVVSAGPGAPEPSTWAMMGVGAGLLGLTLRRRASRV